jgi:hypothetical protein
VTHCGALPEGFAVVLTVVPLSLRDATLGGDIYTLKGGKKALSKCALDRIAAAAGVSWDPYLTCRVDNGGHPFYCEYQAVGHVRLFDGRLTTLKASRAIDLRDGSPELEEIRLSSTQDDGGEGQIRTMRKFILAHAESKAKNRAIRSLGVRPSYNVEELGKPFVVTSLFFNGHSADPDLRREFALMQARAAIGGAQALYGPEASMGPGMGHARMGAMVQRSELRPPPPVGTAPPDSDEEPPEEAPPTHPTEPPPRATQPKPPAQAPQGPMPSSHKPAATAPQRAAAPSQQPANETQGQPVREWTVPYGKNKGLRLSQMSDRQLEWYCEAYANDIQDPEKARFRKSNERHYTILCDELERRRTEYEREQNAQTTFDYDKKFDGDDIPF